MGICLAKLIISAKGDNPRCLDRIVEFLEEQDGYMSIVEEQLLSFYKGNNSVFIISSSCILD